MTTRRLIPPNDLLLAAVAVPVLVFGTNAAAAHQGSQAYRHGPDALMYVLLVVAALALAVRTVRPLVTLSVVVAVVTGYLLIGYPYGPVLGVLVIAVFTVALLVPLRQARLAAAAVWLLVIVAEGADFRSGDVLVQLGVMVASWSGIVLLPWALGASLRGRREHLLQVRDQEARHQADEQRLQVAREVHDVVAHGLAMINIQSGVALHVLDRRPEQAKVALEAIKAASKAGLEDLRATLAVLRNERTAPRAPMAGLDQLDILVQAMAASGLAVTLAVDGDRQPLPVPVDLAAYRIVQESLTNVLRHACATSASVRLSFGPDEVDLEIVDDGRGAGPAADHIGHGLAGMRERAVALGGEVEAGPRSGGGFRVYARLPARGAAS